MHHTCKALQATQCSKFGSALMWFIREMVFLYVYIDIYGVCAMYFIISF